MPDDIDRPPAGTECTSCRAEGHFCPATLYVGNTDIGICQSCRDGSDCPRFKVVHSEPVLFEPDLAGSTSSRAKIIPREEWPEDTAIHEQKVDMADVPVGLRNIVKAEQNGSRILLPAPHSPLQENPVAAWKSSPKPPGNRIPDETRRLIAAEPIDMPYFEVATKYGCSSASVLNIRREAGVEIPARGQGRKHGETYKTEKREMAKTLILDGNSVRKTAAIAGISTNTVRLAKAEIPAADLPAPPPGGFHAHQKQQEYLQRESNVANKIVPTEHRVIPKPEEVLKLAQDLVETRARLAELEVRWESFFAPR